MWISTVVATESPPSSGESSQIFFLANHKRGQKPWGSAKTLNPLSSIDLTHVKSDECPPLRAKKQIF
jgi:hypothetical protein